MNYTIGTIVFDNWKIVQELGEGANGKVFELHKTDYGITVKSALKVIRVPRTMADLKSALSESGDEQSVSSYFQGFVDEIVKEIIVMSTLKSHPNIVGYEDHSVIAHEGEIGWDILIRMELLTPLTDYQLKHPMSEEKVLQLGKEMCSALAFCQKKGMIHRDIKPENIFVSDAGQFKLGDFGVARTIEKTTGGLSRKGTESYMAPEVYLGKPYGAGVDIYSLGLVLYRFTNNTRMPFFPPAPAPITFADRENALGRRMAGEQLPPPAAAGRDFARVILKACAYEAKYRYRTPAEMLADLNMINADGSAAGQQRAYIPEMKDETVQMEKASRASEEKTTGMEDNIYIQDPEERTVGMEGSIPKDERKPPETDETVTGYTIKPDMPDRPGYGGRENSRENAGETVSGKKKNKKGKKLLAGISGVTAAALLIIAFIVFGPLGKKPGIGSEKGDGGKESQSPESFLDSDEKELLSWLQEAMDKYSQNDMREKTKEDSMKSANGGELFDKRVYTIDSKRQVVMMSAFYYKDSPKPDYIDFYTKEGEQEYRYSESYGYDEETDSYGDYNEKMLLDENALDSYRYSYCIQPEEIFGLEESTAASANVEMTDYILSNEGEEDGLIKIKVTGVFHVNEYTREQALEAREISEEDLLLAEDAEQILEECVAQANARYAGDQSISVCYWIGKNDHRLVKSEMEENFDQTEESYNAEAEFSKLSRYIEYCKEYIKRGIPESKARERAEKEAEELISYSPYEERLISSKTTITYKTGSACTTIGELPTEYREITYTQWREDLDASRYGYEEETDAVSQSPEEETAAAPQSTEGETAAVSQSPEVDMSQQNIEGINMSLLLNFPSTISLDAAKQWLAENQYSYTETEDGVIINNQEGVWEVGLDLRSYSDRHKEWYNGNPADNRIQWTVMSGEEEIKQIYGRLKEQFDTVWTRCAGYNYDDDFTDERNPRIVWEEGDRRIQLDVADSTNAEQENLKRLRVSRTDSDRFEVGEMVLDTNLIMNIPVNSMAAVLQWLDENQYIYEPLYEGNDSTYFIYTEKGFVFELQRKSDTEDQISYIKSSTYGCNADEIAAWFVEKLEEVTETKGEDKLEPFNTQGDLTDIRYYLNDREFRFQSNKAAQSVYFTIYPKR